MQRLIRALICAALVVFAAQILFVGAILLAILPFESSLVLLFPLTVVGCIFFRIFSAFRAGGVRLPQTFEGRPEQVRTGSQDAGDRAADEESLEDDERYLGDRAVRENDRPMLGPTRISSSPMGLGPGGPSLLDPHGDSPPTYRDIHRGGF
jgi:hypothetical protein